MSARAVFPRKNEAFSLQGKCFIKENLISSRLTASGNASRAKESERERENDNVDDDLFSSSDGKGAAFEKEEQQVYVHFRVQFVVFLQSATTRRRR
jgi:hypothetical protein